MRISHTDWVEGGWDTAESVELARALRALGADLIDVSSGGLSELQEIPTGPLYQVPGAEAVRRGADIPVAAVGLITTPAEAQSIIRDGKADVVLLARAVLRDPHWPLRAAEALDATDRLQSPPQYQRGWGRYPLHDATAEPMPPI